MCRVRRSLLPAWGCFEAGTFSCFLPRDPVVGKPELSDAAKQACRAVEWVGAARGGDESSQDSGPGLERLPQSELGETLATHTQTYTPSHRHTDIDRFAQTQSRALCPCRLGADLISQNIQLACLQRGRWRRLVPAGVACVGSSASILASAVNAGFLRRGGASSPAAAGGTLGWLPVYKQAVCAVPRRRLRR